MYAIDARDVVANAVAKHAAVLAGQAAELAQFAEALRSEGNVRFAQMLATDHGPSVLTANVNQAVRAAHRQVDTTDIYRALTDAIVAVRVAERDN